MLDTREKELIDRVMELPKMKDISKKKKFAEEGGALILGIKHSYANLEFYSNLLVKGIDPNTRDKKGKTALHHIMGKLTDDVEEYSKISELLLIYGYISFFFNFIF